VESLVHFISDAEFQREFEIFFIDHCRSFHDDEEHRLNYTTIYADFQKLFDRRVQQFCDAEGVTHKEFYKRCERSQTTDVKAAHYIDVMLSSTDYGQFVELMRTMKRMHGKRLDKLDEDEAKILRMTKGMLSEKKKKKKKKKKGGVEHKEGSEEEGEEEEEEEEEEEGAAEAKVGERESREGEGEAKGGDRGYSVGESKNGDDDPPERGSKG